MTCLVGIEPESPSHKLENMNLSSELELIHFQVW